MKKLPLILILLIGMTGCATHQTMPVQSTSLPAGASKINPFGVYDIQAGHGHGQWRPNADKMVR